MTAADAKVAPSAPAFWEIEPYGDAYEALTSEQQGAIDFLSKVDHEGGYVSYLHWGGIDSFPLELRTAARTLETAYTELTEVVGAWAVTRGVRT